MINVLPLEARRREQLRWIIGAVDCFVSTIKNHTEEDIEAAIVTATKNFFKGESGARSVYRGYDHARQQILQRQEARNNVVFLFSLTPNGND